MVEPLGELGKICQKPRYKEAGNWMVRTFLRDAALPITWLLLHTGVTANQVTTASLLIGLLGIFFLALPGAFFFLAGALLLQLWYLLDHVDGQIARYRKTACLSGRFFDFLTHHVIHSALFFALGAYAANRTGQAFFYLFGFAASLGIMTFNLVHDTKYKTFFEKLLAETSWKRREGMPVSEKPSNSVSSKPEGNRRVRRVFSWIHKFCEIHVAMNLLTACAFLTLIPSVSFMDFRFLFFGLYFLAGPFLAIVKSHYLIGGRRIDEEFNSLFYNEPSS